MNRNIAIISIAGSAGKTTFTKHCLQSLVPHAARIEIEDWNSGDGEADLRLSAKSFYSLAAQLNADTSQSFLLDIGTSNSKTMFQHFGDLELTKEAIDYWVVPVRAGSKERIDTLRTLDQLLELGIDPNSIVVIPMAIQDVDTYENDFRDLKNSTEVLGIHFSAQPVLYNEVYNILKNQDRSVFEIAASKPDFKAMRNESIGNEEKMLELGNQMLIYSLSKTAAKNLLAVFDSTPLASAIRSPA